MDFTPGDVITFILTIFSTVLSIIPQITAPQPVDQSSSNLVVFRAIKDILQNRSRSANLFADNLLHIPNSGSLDNNKFESIRNTLAKVVIQYNDDNFDHNSNNAMNNLGNISKSIPECINPFSRNTSLLCNEVWFTNRIVNLEKPDRTAGTHAFDNEDGLMCWQINETGKCSHKELIDMRGHIGSLANVGYLDNFYNNEKKVNSISKSVETFVSDLNRFFISSLISGPSIFLAGITIYLKRKKIE